MAIGRPAGADRAFLQQFGLRVRVVRTGRRMWQEHLAQAAGLDRTYVSRIERGAHNVTVLTLTRVAAVLGVRVADLLPGDGTADLARAVQHLRAEVDRLGGRQ